MAQNTSTQSGTTLLLKPDGHLQESSLQMVSCQEAKYEGAKKASSVDYLAALSNVQRNATDRMPCNTVVKSFPYSSSSVSQSDGRRRRIRRRRRGRKRRNPENVLDVFHALVRVHVEKRLALSGMYSELSSCQFSSPLSVER